ncbi:lysophospholipid acyltransferase family protein [Roseovarius sp. 2305UL8-3]|uniref:lysophospholipid acyltransferase family protein n=1 Tax=Roseovarius conchicola TaxID=3121636 RepID=UPI003527EE6B
MSILAKLTAFAITRFSWLITAVQGFWPGGKPDLRQAVYFANHTSNGDTILLWSVLPASVRQRTRPVAAADYWLNHPVKKFIGEKVFNCVLIQRDPEARTQDPVEQMVGALDDGSSLIIFPEGTRNTEAEMLPFKPGLFHLAEARPNVPLVPVWIENLNRVLPKGEVIPLPFICTVRFGDAIKLDPGEEKAAFLKRAEAAVLALAPEVATS